MKITKQLGLIILIALIPIYANCYDTADRKNTMEATPYIKEKTVEKIDSTVSGETSETQNESGVNAQETVKVQKQIKAKSICIGKDCRSKWPVLKCANYGERPAGETGDEFCGQMKQTCLAVSIGGGQGFFEECSIAASSVHKCRCCWVE